MSEADQQQITVRVTEAIAISKIVDIPGLNNVVLGTTHELKPTTIIPATIEDLNRAHDVAKREAGKAARELVQAKITRRMMAAVGSVPSGLLGGTVTVALVEAASNAEKIAGGGIGAIVGYLGFSGYMGFLTRGQNRETQLKQKMAQRQQAVIEKALKGAAVQSEI